jgi:hypothetical protein
MIAMRFFLKYEKSVHSLYNMQKVHVIKDINGCGNYGSVWWFGGLVHLI